MWANDILISGAEPLRQKPGIPIFWCRQILDHFCTAVVNWKQKSENVTTKVCWQWSAFTSIVYCFKQGLENDWLWQYINIYLMAKTFTAIICWFDGVKCRLWSTDLMGLSFCYDLLIWWGYVSAMIYKFDGDKLNPMINQSVGLSDGSPLWCISFKGHSYCRWSKFTASLIYRSDGVKIHCDLSI